MEPTFNYNGNTLLTFVERRLINCEYLRVFCYRANRKRKKRHLTLTQYNCVCNEKQNPSHFK